MCWSKSCFCSQPGFQNNVYFLSVHNSPECLRYTCSQCVFSLSEQALASFKLPEGSPVVIRRERKFVLMKCEKWDAPAKKTLPHLSEYKLWRSQVEDIAFFSVAFMKDSQGEGNETKDTQAVCQEGCMKWAASQPWVSKLQNRSRQLRRGEMWGRKSLPFQKSNLDQKGNQPSSDNMLGTWGSSDLLRSVILQASK